MGRRQVLWGIWLGFIVYVLAIAPPLPADTVQPLLQLLGGQIPLINPVLISLFSMVGIWLLIYSCLIFPDGRMQRLPAWAFMLASAGTGVLALIPYLALRQPNQDFSGPKDGWLTLLESRFTAITLVISTLVLLAFALFWGDWSAYLFEFQRNKFVHGMSLAFVLFCVLFPYPTLLSDDMARRGLTSRSALFWWVALIPLFGPLAYLCLRPPLLTFRRSQSSDRATALTSHR
ncbi:MAG: hypothetical protein ICV62_10460 [Cyanobacteria bacterium Co-bin13]|nr:hypothetical protein [Cyanobacteria bacterium Co-bin13]